MTHHAQGRDRALEIVIPGGDARPRIHHGGRWIVLDGTSGGPATRAHLGIDGARAIAHHSLARAIAQAATRAPR
ncbi:hypothetical protein [Frondihabitans sucicola]|uniref:hypothetical protein n=1 Tax=Frondihabitans sucicola TaxID=1268041 RepID=UPI002572FD50|nr:hypothetical protein [Frondihabitans sucicola]